jgi:hypothetical protein
MIAWDETLPLESSLANALYSSLRTHQQNVADRLTLEHYMQSGIVITSPDCDGFHKQVTIDYGAVDDPPALSSRISIPITELVHENNNQATQITLGTELKYDLLKYTTINSYTYSGLECTAMALANTARSYIFSKAINFSFPTFCKINMTANTRESETYYSTYGGATVTINAQIDNYPSVLCEGINIKIRPYMILDGECVFIQRYVEVNTTDTVGAVITDSRRLTLATTIDIDYNGV